MPSSPHMEPEQWLINRIRRTAADPPHFEATWYGIYNALLSHYFPYTQRFLIKPQARIREELPDNISVSSTHAEISFSSSESQGRRSTGSSVSISSIGGLVAGSGSTGKKILIPDFFVVKATEFTTQDTPILVVEVKAAVPSTPLRWELAGSQLEEYMMQISQHIPSGTSYRIHGLLICGPQARIISLDSATKRVKEQRGQWNVDTEQFWKFLQGIAKQHWAYK